MHVNSGSLWEKTGLMAYFVFIETNTIFSSCTQESFLSQSANQVPQREAVKAI